MICKLFTIINQYFCFPDRPMKSGDILDSQKGGNLRKRGGLIQKSTGYDPPYQLCILYNFEKQWLSTFACKVKFVSPAQQNFICLVEDRHETFYNEKKCNDKDLIWHMLGEMVKKQGWARLFISCNYSCTFYFLVKILLVKLKNLHTSACLKLNYCTTKHKPKL